MQFEYDPERLIEEVKKRPGIWNYDGREYKTKNMRHQLWSEVVKELMQNDYKLTKSEMRELEIQLQKKWKSIRDCFRKYVCDPSRTRRPYIYTKQLQFLVSGLSNVQKEEVEISSESDDSSKNKLNSSKWRRKLKVKLHRDEDDYSDDDNNTMDNQDCSLDNLSDDILPAATPPPPPTKITKVTKTPTIDEFAFASVTHVDAQAKAEVDDTDKMFLLSLLPHLKSVPEESRLNVKMQLMQVLQNANFKISDYKLL